ncbi:MAG: hypothetical protein PUD24_06125 [Oscillospiraceae bacterium]|nr:hypothetical protein [Oscillospiraceae bacterium]
MKKTVTVIITVICVMIVLILVIHNAVTSGVIDKNNLFNSSMHQNILSGESYSAIADDEGILAVLLKEGANYNLPWADMFTESWDDIGRINIKFDSLMLSKSIDGRYSSKKINTDGQSYAFVDITMTNLGDRSFESTLNRFYLIIGPQHGYELFGYNSDKPENAQDYYHITFEPGIEYHFSLVYVVDDDIYSEFENERFLYVSILDNGNDWHDTVPVIEKAE